MFSLVRGSIQVKGEKFSSSKKKSFACESHRVPISRAPCAPFFGTKKGTLCTLSRGPKAPCAPFQNPVPGGFGRVSCSGFSGTLCTLDTKELRGHSGAQGARPVHRGRTPKRCTGGAQKSGAQGAFYP